MYFTEHPHEWVEYTKKILGGKYDQLFALSKSTAKVTASDQQIIAQDLIRRIEDMGEKPCWQGRTNIKKKKKSKYKKKISGEVVLR